MENPANAANGNPAVKPAAKAAPNQGSYASPEATRKPESQSGLDKRALAYLVVGFASLVGGIFMFVFIVVPQRRPETGVPRDVQMIFTELYSQQNLLRTERGRFSPALIELNVDQETCRRYSCLLTLNPDGLDYIFRLSKDAKTWAIQAASPVPKEVP